VEEVNEYDTITYPPAYDVSGKLDEYQQRQKDFNKQLLEQLNQQQKYIVKLVESSNEDVQESKRLISPEERRAERFEQVMAEHKVKRVLEKETMDLWNAKPVEERMIRVGWFRKEEDKDKRDLLIKTYINEHFEEYLKMEFDI